MLSVNYGRSLEASPWKVSIWTYTTDTLKCRTRKRTGCDLTSTGGQMIHIDVIHINANGICDSPLCREWYFATVRCDRRPGRWMWHTSYLFASSFAPDWSKMIQSIRNDRRPLRIDSLSTAAKGEQVWPNEPGLWYQAGTTRTLKSTF